MFRRIVNSPLELPSHLSHNARDLLKKLLQKNPSSRIGATGGIAEIKRHPFFSTVDFEAVWQKRIIPPFVPELEESYFDTEYLEK